MFQTSKYIKDIINHAAPVLIKECFWGDDETYTQEILTSFFKELGANTISIFYDAETAIQVSSDVFCKRWSDFCYPSDLNLRQHRTELVVQIRSQIFRQIVQK